MMNQPSSSGSLDALISICPPKEEKNPKKKQIYSREFQAILDGLEEEDRLEEAAQATEKKRRLSMVQVKALEKNFEVENKLEPERKVKLAEELGLQPRQIAIWFQNRRARWKTKQLEKDYAVLKANYDSLKLNYNNLEQENEALIEKLRELKAKLKEENSESNESVKEDSPILSQPITKGHDFCDNDDFDSDAIIKEKSNAMIAQQLLMSPASSSFQFNGSSSSSDSSNHQWFQPRVILGNMYNPQLVKVEEQQCMFSAEECCNFFSVDQAPTLQWYFTGQ